MVVIQLGSSNEYCSECLDIILCVWKASDDRGNCLSEYSSLLYNWESGNLEDGSYWELLGVTADKERV
jgi:hypothetical protein